MGGRVPASSQAARKATIGTGLVPCRQAARVWRLNMVVLPVSGASRRQSSELERPVS